MNLIRPLLATAAVALGGSTLLVPPASQWLLWLGLTAVGLVGFIGVQIALNVAETAGDRFWTWLWQDTSYGRHRDARRRNAAFRSIRDER